MAMAKVSDIAVVDYFLGGHPRGLENAQSRQFFFDTRWQYPILIPILPILLDLLILV
jgi:hypothetical protein